MDQDDFTLSQRPDVAHAVGALFMAVANFEATLMGAFATLLDQPNRVAAAIFENIDNISARAAIVFELAVTLPNTPLAEEVRARKSEILAALAMRNKLAHSLFGSDAETREILLMQNFLSNRRGPPKRDALDPAALMQHVQNLSNASGIIANLTDDVDLTPRHRIKDKG